MTTAQIVRTMSLFRRLWAVRGVSFSGSTAERSARLRLVSRVLGREVDTIKHLRNDEVDCLWKVLHSVVDGADLESQLALVDQPLTRLLWSCRSLLDGLGIARDDTTREAYLDGIARRACGGRRCFELVDAADRQKVIAACDHTLSHRIRREHAHPPQGSPRSRYPRFGPRSSDHWYRENPCAAPPAAQEIIAADVAADHAAVTTTADPSDDPF